MTVSVKHNTLTTESPTGAGGTVGATEWNEGHEVQMAADRLLGRTTAGTGAVEEISIGTGLSMAAGVLSASGGGGGDAYVRRPTMFALGGNPSLILVGAGRNATTFTDTGTKTGALNDGTIDYTKWTSAATANSGAGFKHALDEYVPPLSSLGSPGIGVSGTLVFPDASYGSGSTGARIGFGVGHDGTLATDHLGGDDGAASNSARGIWFSYSTNRGPNWFIVIRALAASVTTVDTGVAFSVGTWNFALDLKEDSAAFDWRIRKVGATATTGTVTSASNPMPVVGSSNFYNIFAGLVTLTATARVIGVRRIGLDILEPV